jgi:hypothetical protein
MYAGHHHHALQVKAQAKAEGGGVPAAEAGAVWWSMQHAALDAAVDFESTLQTLRMCDLREPIELLGIRASTSLLAQIASAGVALASLIVRSGGSMAAKKNQ